MEEGGAGGRSVYKAPWEELFRPPQDPKASQMGAEGMGPSRSGFSSLS